MSEGGASIDIYGKGIYDSAIKRVKFISRGVQGIEKGEREVTAEWDRKKRCLKCIVPPLTWLWGGAEMTEEQINKIKKNPINMFITFNNQEWIPGENFRYHDHFVKRIAYAHNFMGETPEPE